MEVNYMEISKFLSYIYLYLTPAVIFSIAPMYLFIRSFYGRFESIKRSTNS